MRDQSLFHFHQTIQIAEGDLRFEHPELGEVAARLRFFRAEGRTEAIDFPKCENVGFVVELSCLREIGLAFVKVFRFEKCGCPFGRSGREDRRIEIEKAMAIQVFAHRRHDLDTHFQDRPLALHADPQVTVVEREVHDRDP